MDVYDELDYNEDIENFCDNSSVNMGENMEQENKECDDLLGFNDLCLQLDCPEEQKELEMEYKSSSALVSNTQNIKDEKKNESFDEKKIPKKEERGQIKELIDHSDSFRKKNKKRKRFRFRENNNSRMSFGFNSSLKSRVYSNTTQPVPLLALNVPNPAWTQPGDFMEPPHISNNRFSSSGMVGSNFELEYHRNLNNLSYTSFLNNSGNVDRDTFGQSFFHTPSTNGFVNSIPEACEDRNGIVCQESNILFQPFTFKPLEEDEKRRVLLQKEARLRRFKEDEAKIKRDMLYSNKEKRSVTNLNLDLKLDYDYLQKIEEQKLIREKILTLKEQLREQSKDQNHNFVSVWPSLNKEFLLLMNNPFDSTSASPNRVRESKINQEVECIKIKAESSDGFYCLASPIKGVFVDKNDLENAMSTEMSSVNSVKTIPRSFDEFETEKREIISKEKGNESDSLYKSLPFVTEKDTNYEINVCSNQTESYLNGCIVKVLNMSPSSTIYDILDLCKPIGPVKEIKLNFPKENSVVMRFADPFSAEKFYKIYHGQKMNDYFLHVVVV